MGLISDYLEQNRENLGRAEVDPCMILDHGLYGEKTTDKCVEYLLSAYRQASSENDKKARRDQLISQTAELETLKAEYLLEEKTVLSVINRQMLRSPFLQDLMHLLSEELRRSYYAVCDLRLRIDQEIGEHMAPVFTIGTEKAVKLKLLRLIISSVLVYLRQEILDTSEFRKIIGDMAELIKYMEETDFNQPCKKIVKYYLEREFDMKETQTRCCNCHSKLLEELPYCLNCYERN